MRNGIGIFVMILLATSCYREVTLELPGDQGGLLVNAQLSTADKNHSVFVGTCSPSRVSPLHSAEVLCSVNGGERIKAEEVMVGGKPQVEYRFNTVLNPGDKVTIDVSDTDGRTAGAEVEVPEQTGEIVSIDTSSVDGKVYFSIKVRDNRDGPNYYMLTLDNKYKAILQDVVPYEGTVFDFEVTGSRKGIRLFNDNDPILSGGHVGGFGGDDIIGSGVENVNCVFSNLHFNDGITTINVYADSTMLYDDDIIDYYISGVKYNTATISLHCVSKMEFDYLWTLNTFQVSGFHMSEMMEPASIPMNVSGGYGFVSVSSCDSKEIGLRRQYLRLKSS